MKGCLLKNNSTMFFMTLKKQIGNFAIGPKLQSKRFI